MQYRDSTNTYYAGFGVRLAAFITDSLLVGAALLIVRLPYLISILANPENTLNTPVLFRYTPFDILIYLLSSLYYVLMLYYSGASLGKKLFRLKIVKADGGKITLIDAIYRETIGKYLSGIIIFIGYLMIAVDDEKRSLHDRLCDTRVIYDLKAPQRSAGMPVIQPLPPIEPQESI